MDLSVILPTHNPHPGRLRRTLAGLRAQTLAPARWETVLVDNASNPAIERDACASDAPAALRIVRETELGLTAARRRGLAETNSPVIVLVDDDNVLAPDYLERIVTLFAAHERVGALGGKSVPEFESSPPAWTREFNGLIACRDLGPVAQISHGLRPAGSTRNEYPLFAPIGAGMALRRAAVQTWLAGAQRGGPTDRRGGELTSGGDNDIILHAMKSGWEVGYFPELSLTHLIPAGRLERDYLARLNRGIAKSWVQVLARHDACPWRPIAPWTVPLRQRKAWFNYRPWAGPAEYIRWQGACGHFEGLATLNRT
ncbi:MAG TPA: glycosyltransferase [Candidatus Didemnitutus sp.]|nr:glycosyltransferase [Candidatus Didemnitutus sp.]